MKHVSFHKSIFSLCVLLSAQGLSVTCVDPVSNVLYIYSFKQVATRCTTFFNSTQVGKLPHPHHLFQIKDTKVLLVSSHLSLFLHYLLSISFTSARPLKLTVQKRHIKS